MLSDLVQRSGAPDLRRRARTSLVALVALVTLASGCGDDDNSADAEPATSTSGAPVTSVVPRADDDEQLTAELPAIDGYQYVTVDDAFVLPVFRDLIAAPGSEEVIEQFAARLVSDEIDEGFALVFVGRLGRDYRDPQSIVDVFARSQSSRVIAGQRVFVVRVLTQTESGEAYRYLWARDGFLYAAYGEDAGRVEELITAFLRAADGDDSS